jgi:hypothetical protein
MRTDKLRIFGYRQRGGEAHRRLWACGPSNGLSFTAGGHDKVLVRSDFCGATVGDRRLLFHGYKSECKLLLDDNAQMFE